MPAVNNTQRAFLYLDQDIVLPCYLISCSKLLKSSESKNSLSEMPRPSHIFLMDTIPGF